MLLSLFHPLYNLPAN